MRGLASRLATERGRISASWCARAEAEIPARVRELGPGIASILDDILASLGGRAEGAASGLERISPDRARDVCVERSIREIALLRRIVLATLETDDAPLPAPQRSVLLDELAAWTGWIADNGALHRTARRDAEEWLEVAVRAGGIGAWRWDLGPGHFEVTRNERYDQIFGISHAEPWTSEKLYAFVHPDERAMVRGKLEALAAGETDVYEALYRIRRRDGTIRWISAHGRGVRDDAGRVVRLTGALRDVTDEVRLRAERDQLVAGLSHDLRNPLAAARANAELLARFGRRIEGQADTLLEKIVLNVDRVDRMIGDLLDLSRMEAGRPLELRWCDGDLAAVALETVETLSAVYGDRFRLDAEGEFSGRWPCDALQRVVENLATNAAKYGHPTAPVTVTLSRAAGVVVVAVHDEGQPIAPELQSSLCQPYSRASDAHAQGTKGWGLGLTVVHGIARTLGGRVEVESRAGHGTTFRFVFPDAVPGAGAP